jgi:hypothetical protein
LASLEGQKVDRYWYLGLGVSTYVTRYSSFLTSVKSLFHTPNIKITGGQSHDVVWKGTMHVETLSSGIKRIVNILYFLGLKKNLLNIGKITSLGT